MVKNLLASVKIFQDLEMEELELIRKSAKEMTFPEDTVIFEQGDAGNKMYLILEGVVEIWKSDGREIKGSRLARLKSGEVFGEMALFDKEPRSASTVTSPARETRMLVWEEKDLFEIVESRPTLGVKLFLNFLRAMSSRLRIANDAIHTLLRSNQYIGL